MAGPEDDNEFKKVQLVLMCEFCPHLFLISTGKGCFDLSAIIQFFKTIIF